jgi:hypothetical protein
MKALATSLQNRFATIQAPKPKSTITNQRQEIVKMFLDRLNAARAGTKYKQLTARTVALRMQWWKTNQALREFYGYCNEAKNFSSTWWWMTNPKNYPLDRKQEII